LEASGNNKMEVEVMGLLDVDDEVHWERAGLFTSVDELCSSYDKRHHHNGGINASFTTVAEVPYHPNSSTIPSHLAGRETTLLNQRISVPRPKGEVVGITFGCGEQGKVAQVERTQSVDTFLPSEARLSGLQGEHTTQKRGSHKRLTWVWRPKCKKHRLVMGMDVGLDEACNLALCALVGRLSYQSWCKQPLTEWMQCNWEPVLGYSPEVLSLLSGWLGFVFKSPEDSVNILESFWGYGGGSLMLKRWWISFNLSMEYFSFHHLWVLLPGLPLQLWNVKALEVIGNALGHFIKVDNQALLSSDKRMAKVLVEVYIHAGLLETLEIEWRGHLFVQRLDYLGLPFRCSLCRQTGHLRKDCTCIYGALVEEDSSKDTPVDDYSPLMDAQEPGDYSGLRTEESPEPADTTFIGKLKFYCPSLYFSLSSWERDHLDSVFLWICYTSQGWVRENLWTQFKRPKT
jgi:hypothetical protein